MDDTQLPLGGAGGTGVGQGSVAEFFDKGAHLYSTRSAECFEAVDRAAGDRVLLWLLRYPLALDSDAPEHFTRRLAVVSGLSASMPALRRCGVDGRGIAFAAFEYVRGRNPLENTSAPRVAERTFMEILQVLDTFHRAGIAFGDVCAESFVLDERGRSVILAVLGSFETGARQTAMLPPPETLPYLSPEQRTVGGADISADVYAMGVYGYRLFTGKPVPAEVGNAQTDITAVLPPPSSARQDLPSWVDDVLGRCLELSPNTRFRDAGEVLGVIQEALRTGSPPGGQGKWSRRTLVVSRPKEDVIRPRALDRKAAPPSVRREPVTEAARERATHRVSKAVNTFTWTVAVLVGLIGAGLLFYSFERMSGSKADDPCSVLSHNEYAPSELKPLIFDVTAKDLPFERRESALRKISENSDPIAYSILIAYTSCKTEDRLSSSAEQFILERMKRQGDERSAGILQKWMEDLTSKGVVAAQQPEYPLFLRAVDGSRPLESRQQALREASPRAQAATLKLTAALTLDEKEERFIGVLREFLREAQPSVQFDGHGVGALILSSSVLSQAFAGELSAIIPRFSPDDLKWVAERLADSDTGFIFEVAKEFVHQRLAPPFQMIFLRALGDAGKGKLTPPVQRALVRGGLGKLSRDDAMQLGRWMSLDAEDALFAACATMSDASSAVDAMDVLGSRTLNNEPGSSLIKWVKARLWEYRTKVVKAIGILALADIAADSDLDYAFGVVAPFAADGSLVRAIVQSGNEKLIRIALSRLGDRTVAEDLLALLEHRSRAVRIEAVRALKGRNELSVLQGILRGYAREQDEEVRQTYRENHWVTQDRDPSKILNK